MAVITKVGDGSNSLFWKDRWLNGRGIKGIAPAVFDLVPKRIRNKRKVSEALQNSRWIADFRGDLTLLVLVEYFDPFQELQQIDLQLGMPDGHIWKLSSSGQFSSKSAYTAMTQGAISFEPAERVWKTWSPSKCKFFIWLVEHDRCWIADKLAKRGLDFAPCVISSPTINHLLVSCIFARQVWAGLLQPVGLVSLVPQPTEASFESWWCTSSLSGVGRAAKKGLQFISSVGCVVYLEA
jgi:hypothetical protein